MPFYVLVERYAVRLRQIAVFVAQHLGEKSYVVIQALYYTAFYGFVNKTIDKIAYCVLM